MYRECQRSSELLFFGEELSVVKTALREMKE